MAQAGVRLLSPALALTREEANRIGGESHSLEARGKKGKVMPRGHQFGVPLSAAHKRALSESLKGRPNLALAGMPKSEEHRRKISDTLRGRPRPIEASRKASQTMRRKILDGSFKPTPNYSGRRVAVWCRETQQPVVLRSLAEATFVRWLDKQGKRWLYETMPMLLDDGHTYTPDFYVLDDMEFVEIKRFMREKDWLRAQSFITSYPCLPYRVVCVLDDRAEGTSFEEVTSNGVSSN